MERLTPTQAKALEFIRDFTEAHGWAPTLEEIGGGLGVAKATVQQYLRALEEKGAIRRRRYAHRSIELVEPPEASRRGELPIVGRIAAGSPLEAIEDGEAADIPGLLGVREGRDCFILRVKGDSMIEDGILDGDYVVVERRSTARNGETVVALLPDNTATLKRFYREKGRVRLQPANVDMAPIYAKEVEIQGIVRGVFRAAP